MIVFDMQASVVRSNYSANCATTSVTRLGDLLHFGQLFKVGGKNYFAQITHIFGNFCKGVKIFHFSSAIIFGQLLKRFGNLLLVTLLAGATETNRQQCCVIWCIRYVAQMHTNYDVAHPQAMSYCKNVWSIAPFLCLRMYGCIYIRLYLRL